MAAAIGRVATQTGSLSGQVQGLKRDSGQLLDQLRQVDDQARAAADSLRRMRDDMASGKGVRASEFVAIDDLKNLIIDKGGAVGREFVHQFEAEMSAAQAARRGGAAMAAPPHGPVLPPRPVQPSAPAPTPAAPLPQPSFTLTPLPGADLKPRAPTPAGRRGAAEVLEERKRIEEEHAAQIQHVTSDKRVDVLTDRELQQQWTRSSRALSEYNRELGKSQLELRKLDAFKRGGVDLGTDDDVRERLERKIRAVTNANVDLVTRHGELATERDRRGAARAAEQERLEGLQGHRKHLSAFLGAGGFGAGGFGGMVGGALLGELSPTMAAAAALGLTLGYAWRFAQQGAEQYEATQRLVFDTGTRLGGGFGDLRATGAAGMRGPLRLRFAETMGATLALSQQTGQTDIGGVAAFARAYGLPVEATADLIGKMGALGVMPMAREVSSTRPRRPAPAIMAAFPSGGIPTSRRVEPATAAGRSAEHADLLTRAFRWASELVTPNPSSDEVEAIVRGERPGEAAAAGKDAELRERLAGERNPDNRAALEQRLRRNDAARRAAREETVTRRFGRGLPEILAGAYRRSAYRRLPASRRNAFMSAFLQQTGRVLQAQAAGGAPVMNYELGPAMLAEATRAFGADVNPQFAGQVVGGVVETLTQPKNEVARGIQLRSVLDMARQMSPDELEDFRKSTTKMVPGGINLNSYMGSLAALQNAAALPPKQASMVLRASLRGLQGAVGGGELQQLMFMDAFNGQAAPALAASGLVEKLLAAQPGSTEDVNLTRDFQKLVDQAGGEASPFMNDARVSELQTQVGAPLKQLGQGITDSILDFIDTLRGAQSAWETGVPMSQGVQQSDGGF